MHNNTSRFKVYRTSKTSFLARSSYVHLIFIHVMDVEFPCLLLSQKFKKFESYISKYMIEIYYSINFKIYKFLFININEKIDIIVININITIINREQIVIDIKN